MSKSIAHQKREVATRITLLTLLTLFTLFILFILLKLLYTAQTVGCMPIYVVMLGEVRMLLEWTDELLSKKWSDGLGDWMDPLDCYDY